MFSFLKDNRFFIQSTNPIYSQAVIIFTVIDMLATAIIGLSTLMAPNLSVQIFKKEPTMVILFIIVAIMIGLSFRRFTTKPIFNLARFIISFVITIFIIYTTYSLFVWYTSNVEGIFSYRFLVLTKKASLEDKISFYNLLVSQMIDALRVNDNSLAAFLEKAPSIYNAPKLNITPYHDIPALVEQTIMAETINYKKMIANVKATNVHNGNSIYPITFKTVALWFSVGLLAIGVVYCLYSMDSLKGMLKKSLELQQDTQTQFERAIRR